jgi:hypothetical protein
MPSCTERDWRQSQQLRCIQFGSDEPSLSGQIIGSWRPVSENSPGANASDVETADMWIWGLVIDQRSEYTAAHQKATKKGWLDDVVNKDKSQRIHRRHTCVGSVFAR